MRRNELVFPDQNYVKRINVFPNSVFNGVGGSLIGLSVMMDIITERGEAQEFMYMTINVRKTQTH